MTARRKDPIRSKFKLDPIRNKRKDPIKSKFKLDPTKNKRKPPKKREKMTPEQKRQLKKYVDMALAGTLRYAKKPKFLK